MNRYDVILIGSGLGSLLCAYILSKEGFSVCVLEKNASTGGCLQTFTRRNNVFDTGLHYVGGLLPGQVLHSYWTYFGISRAVEFKRMDEDCFDQIVFPDEEFSFAQGFGNFHEQLRKKFPDSGKFLEKYLSSMKDTVGEFPLYNFRLPVSYGDSSTMNLNAAVHMKELTGGDPENLRLLNVLPGNNFLYAGKPGTTPWYQYALINHSFISSAWRVRGGSSKISDHLISSVRSFGGQVIPGREVRKIIRLKDKFQVGTAGDELFVASRIISGIHPQQALRILDPEMVRKSFRTRISSMKNTVSCFGLYLSLKPGKFPYFNHNVYYHDSQDVWNDQKAKDERWPSMYFLYTPAEGDDGKFAHSACILSFMQYDEVKAWENTHTGKRGAEYGNFKKERAERLLRMVEKKFPDLVSAITSAETSTPLTWRDYTGTSEGSIYGIRKESGNYLRTLILPHTKIPGFYFTGQNTNQHGAPGVTIGAIMTCGDIIGMEYLVKKIRDAV